MDPRRRRRDPFWSLFDDEDFGFGVRDEVRELMEHTVKSLNRAMSKDLDKLRQGEPYVYGFSMKVGPDGVPHIEEFGNTAEREYSRDGLEGGREPLTDVIKEDKEVTVIAELPGIEKSDIDLTTRKESLTIKVDTDKRKYFKKLPLPAEVDTDSAKASYKNGILEVRMKRKEQEKPAGKKIRIE